MHVPLHPIAIPPLCPTKRNLSRKSMETTGSAYAAAEHKVSCSLHELSLWLAQRSRGGKSRSKEWKVFWEDQTIWGSSVKYGLLFTFSQNTQYFPQKNYQLCVSCIHENQLNYLGKSVFKLSLDANGLLVIAKQITESRGRKWDSM